MIILDFVFIAQETQNYLAFQLFYSTISMKKN